MEDVRRLMSRKVEQAREGLAKAARGYGAVFAGIQSGIGKLASALKGTKNGHRTTRQTPPSDR